MSGGLDSTTVLAIAQSKNYQCFTINFNYGQRHKYEIKAAAEIAKEMKVSKHCEFKLNLSQFGGSALTDHAIEVPHYCSDGKIPITYVPARNTIFLSIALAYAEVINAHDIFLGVSSIDYSGYPDCRPEYLDAFQNMANLATKIGVEGNHTTIHAPLVNLSKAETIKIGINLGVDYGKTISCYAANDLGLACGRCDSCVLRKNGFEKAGVNDPTRYITMSPK